MTDRNEGAFHGLFDAMESGRNGSLKRLAAAKKALKTEDWNSFAGEVIRQLGGEKISPEAFVSKYNSLDPVALDLVFGARGGSAREHLEKLNKAMNLVQQVEKAAAPAKSELVLRKLIDLSLLNAGVQTHKLKETVAALAAGGISAKAMSSPAVLHAVVQGIRMRRPIYQITSAALKAGAGYNSAQKAARKP